MDELYQKLFDLGLPVEDNKFTRNLTEEEQEIYTMVVRGWDYIRDKRNALLVQCDWTNTSDAVLLANEKEAWSTYRQTLRNIPQDYESPEDVIWPEVPA